MAIREDLFRICIENHLYWISDRERFMELLYLINYGRYVEQEHAMEIEDWKWKTLDEEVIHLGHCLCGMMNLHLKDHDELLEYIGSYRPTEEIPKIFGHIFERELERSNFNLLLDEHGILPSEDTAKFDVIVNHMTDEIVDGLRGKVNFF